MLHQLIQQIYCAMETGNFERANTLMSELIEVDSVEAQAVQEDLKQQYGG